MAELEIVWIRVMGPAAAVDQLAADLQAAGLPWCDVRAVSAPYANRGGAEVRRYLTVLVPVRPRQAADEAGADDREVRCHG